MSRNGAALVSMLGSMVLGSLIPLAFTILGDLSGPFFFLAAWRFGSGLACVPGLLLCIWFVSWPDRAVLARSWRRLFCLPVFLTVIGNLDYGFFLLSLRFISAPVAAVLVESHLLLGSCVLLFRSGERYLDRVWLLVLLLPVGLLGVFLLLASEYGGLGFILEDFGAGGGLRPLWGVVLAFVGALVISPAYLLMRWADRMGWEMPGVCSPGRRSVVLAIAGAMMGSFLVVPLCLLIGLFSGELLPGNSTLGLAFLGGFFLSGPALQGWRVSLTLTSYVGVGSLVYLIPLLALGWYWLLGMTGSVEVPLLLSGLALILVSSFLLQIQSLLGNGRRRVAVGPPGGGGPGV